MSTDTPQFLNNNYLLTDQSESIQNFAQRFSRSSEFYNAHEELIVLRYALSEKIRILSTLSDLLKQQATTEQLSFQEAAGYMKQAATLSNEIMVSIERTVKTLKTGAEIDFIADTKLDGVQLLYILERIPVILGEVLKGLLSEYLENSSENKVPIDELIDNIITLFTKELKNSKVLSNQNKDENSQGSVTLDQLKGMIESVPVEE